MHITPIKALYYLFYAIELPNLFLLKRLASSLFLAWTFNFREG